MLAAVAAVAAAVLAGCAGDTLQRPPPRSPEAIEADIAALMPSSVANRAAWASDLQLILAALKIEPSDANVCAVLAVTEQESTYRADPAVPNLAKISRDEIFKRADEAGVPAVAVRLALQLNSPDGRSWDDRLDAVKTERELSVIYEQFIDQVPLGRRLLGSYNPVRTGGPMQVSIAYAEGHARAKPYPFPVRDTIRHEVFTRRGGLYFGTAHLLDYAAPYGAEMIYRFADFNAGHYASRNAAFQQAVATASGRTLDLDGDLILPGAAGDSPPGQTEAAVRALSGALGMDAREIRRELQRGDKAGFERSPLYTKVFALAEQRAGKRLPRAALPRIVLRSPKITRQLTTEWFARRVDERYQRCLRRAAG
jgi:hypothetical protein